MGMCLILIYTTRKQFYGIFRASRSNISILYFISFSEEGTGLFNISFSIRNRLTSLRKANNSTGSSESKV